MKNKKFLQGTIKRHPDGFGFFIPEQVDHPDVYIPRHSMKGAMTNDKVMIEAFPEKGSNRFYGEILKILSRGSRTIVGSFHKLNSSTGLLRDDGKGWGEDMKIAVADSKGAKNGQLISAEILSYPGDANGFTGRVKEVIGDAADPLTDVKRVIAKNDIPNTFPPAVLGEAESFTEHVSEKDMKGRKNLRSLNFITIDGATAKDFDDAIYVEQNARGFLLYVAIADVSHYVKIGTAIDEEAYVRGNSVYFPNFVIPMLPEVLSNGLCSLNPHVPRLALVAEMQMDFTGVVTHSDFYEAVIESKARVTYGEAQEVIDGNPVEKLKHVHAEILRASDLAKILMAKRFREGSLDLEIPEVEIVLDGSGVPVDMIKSERLFAHRLIEEMMLAANVAVATFLSSKDIPALYRIHEPPNAEALSLLERYLWNFGSQIDMQAGKLQKRLTRALQDFDGKPEAQILNILTLRSMSQAKYSPNNLGHFGLGFEFYTHFTSPIRRYPDLIVHRLIKNQVVAGAAYRLMSEEDLATAGTMLSATEQRATKSERQFQSIKKARFMQKFIGQEFEGMISSVTKFGVFVLLRNFEVDGLVRLESLSKERLEFDEENLVLVGKRSGVRFSIGDIVKIRVANADPEAGQVDFELVEKEIEKTEENRAADKALLRRGEHPRRERDDRSSRSARRPQGGQRPQSQQSSQRQQEQQRSQGGQRNPSPQGGRNQSQPKNFNKSKKAQALDRMEKAVFEFLSEANDEVSKKSDQGGFNPEAHLRQAIEKWKQRNVPEDRRFRREDKETRGSRPDDKVIQRFDKKKKEERNERNDRHHQKNEKGGSRRGRR
jgi:ribonuclease R